VRDQLDDAPCRIVEVDGARIPVREVEDGITRVGVGQELYGVASPCEGRVEAVARDEKRDVVEGRALGGRELEHGLADSHLQAIIAAAGQRQTEPAAVERGESGNALSRGGEPEVADLERHRAD
jgi:hypothetical protein